MDAFRVRNRLPAPLSAAHRFLFSLKMPPAGRSDPPHHPDDRTVGYFVILTTLVTKLKTAFL